MNCPWGQKAFKAYLGEDKSAWEQYDASVLVTKAEEKLTLLVDQGKADEFLPTQLLPEALEKACKLAGHPITLRYHEHYDHSYYFIASFIEEHLRYHAKALCD